MINSNNKNNSIMVFCRPIQVCVKNGSEERNVNLTVSIEKNENGIKREISVRLTDENNLYFLYNLVLSEEDFQVLKVQQGLLVDFSLFPQKFVELLNFCLKEQHRDKPKFYLSLTVNSFGIPMETSSATLEVIETNPFKHLVHLSLKLVSGSDKDVKHHLASCLQKLKVEKQEIVGKMESNESELRSKCEYIQELLSNRTSEVEKLKRQLREATSELSIKQSDQLNLHKDSMSELRTEYEIKLEKCKQELNGKHRKSVQTLEERAINAEAKKTLLSTEVNKANGMLHELQAQLARAEPELYKLRGQFQNLQSEHNALEVKYQELRRIHDRSENRLNAVEHELKDKQEVFSNNKHLLQVTQEQKMLLEKQNSDKSALIVKRENTLKTLSEEVKKANEIISKLQNEIKSNHSKLKVRGQIATEQEKILTQNEGTLKKVSSEKEALQAEIEVRDAEICKLKSEKEEANKHLKTNENVINWLNKQLNEVQVGPRQNQNLDLPRSRLINYYDSHIQPSVASASINSRLQTPHVNFAHNNRTDSRLGLGEQYFRRTMPMSQSTPYMNSVEAREQGQSGPNSTNSRIQKSSDNNLAGKSKTTPPAIAANKNLPSAYFKKQSPATS